MIDTTTVLLFVIVLILSWCYLRARRPHGINLPPGPPTRPFIGNLGYVYNNHRFHQTLHELYKKYGGVFSLQMASQPAVVISDVDIMREALVEKSQYFSDRPLHLPLIKLIFRGNGLVFQNGDKWEKLRRLVVSSMRNFGVGKATIEDRIQEECVNVINEIENTNGTLFNPKDTFQKSTCNIICSVLFGNRFEYKNREFAGFLDNLSYIFANGVFQNFAVYLHVFALHVLFFIQPSIMFMAGYTYKTRSFARRRVKEHRDSFDPDNIRDFVDMYLKAESSSKSDAAYSDGMIFQSIMDVFFAGTETTSTTLLWTFLFLIKNPAVQDKCRREILEIVGDQRAPCMKDKASLPYLEATTRETMRLGLPTPIAGLHSASANCTLAGYTIPKNTVVVTNFYSIHMDPEKWPEPHIFKPERFLDEEGQLINHDQYMPFGLGKRKCMGDGLAKQELFLVISTLLQKYRFSAKDISALPPNESATMGVTLVPPPYEMIAQRL